MTRTSVFRSRKEPRLSLASFGAMLLAIGVPFFVATAHAQAPKAATKAAPAAKTTATEQKAAEPATPEEAAKVLDLRTFPVLTGAKLSDNRTLGMLIYEAQATPKAAFDFQRQELVKRGFKELPGGYNSADTNTGSFLKEGYHVAVSASAQSGDPAKVGWSYISIVNDGNVAVDKLPVPPGVKPFYPQAYQAAYTTDAKVPETAAACRKLLLAAGWEPYGQAGNEGDDPNSSMQYFKRNAVKLQSWVSVTPAEGGKTLIRYDAELLSADLPAPPNVANPDYTDSQKTLRFDSPNTQTDAIIAFYQERLPKMGWKATTERPVVDDRTKSQFLVYRNPQKEFLMLDLTQFTDIVRVSLRHQSVLEFEEEERLAKEHAAKAKLAEEKRNMKVKIVVPVPANAGEVETSSANLFEFTHASGSGPATLEAYRKHFSKEGWTEEKGMEFMKNVGEVNFTKDALRLRISYFDTGFTAAEIRVSGSSNVVLEAAASKAKPTADAPKPEKKPTIPGLPTLPPGVDLPPDVEAELKKALGGAGLKDLPGVPKIPGKK